MTDIVDQYAIRAEMREIISGNNNRPLTEGQVLAKLFSALIDTVDPKHTREGE